MWLKRCEQTAALGLRETGFIHYFVRMTAFETGAILDDARHLTLREPVPTAAGRECRVIVLFDPVDDFPAAWPPNFFDEIRIDDPSFERPTQGDLPPAPTLDE